MKRLFCVLTFLLLGSMFLQAQTIVTIGVQGPYSNKGPLTAYYGYQRSVDIYRPSDGLIPGYIGTLGWFKTSQFEFLPSLKMPVTIYLKEVTDSVLDYPTNLIWDSLISGAKKVFTGSVSPPPGFGWIMTDLDSSFHYSGTKNLMVLVATDFGGNGMAGGFTMDYTATPTTGRNTHAEVMKSYNVTTGGMNDGVSFYTNSIAATSNISRSNIRILTYATPTPCRAVANLKATLRTTTDTRLVWSKMGNESSWLVSYKTNAASTYIDSVVTDTTCLLSSLTPGTTYEVQVRALCGIGDSSTIVSVTFTTECAVPELPLVQGFEGFATGTLLNPNAPTCWSYIKTEDNASNIVTVAHNSTRGYNLNYATTSSVNAKALLISPRLSQRLDTLRVEFWAYYAAGYDSLEVGYMNSITDTSTFYCVAKEKLAGAWKRHIVSFENIAIPATAHYIAFNLKPNQILNSNVYIDDIIIENAPHCDDVFSELIAIDDITTTTAKISYPPMPTTIPNYDIRYRIAGTATWSENSLVALPYTLSNLSHSKKYELIVRSNCGGADSGSWSDMITFTTAFRIPIAEYFDSSTTIPVGWGFRTTHTSSYADASTADKATGTRSARLYVPTSVPAANNLYLISPKIDPQVSMNTLQVRFKAKGARMSLVVGVMNTDSITSFEPIDTIVLTGTWDTYVVPLIDYAGTNRHIAFGSSGNSSIAAALYIDNVDITPIPACPEPNRLKASNLDDQGFTLNWESPAFPDFIVEYGVPGRDTFEIQVQGNSHTLSGLSPLTSYTVRVKADCASAIWTDSIEVLTTLLPEMVPYIDDFENIEDTSWTFLNGTYTNKWYIDSTAGVNNTENGRRGLYISNSNGDTNAYTINRASNVQASKVLKFENPGIYSIDYDWKSVGDANDYMQVWMVPTGSYPSVVGAIAPAADWINLFGATNTAKLNLQPTWKHVQRAFTIPQAGTYRLLVYWVNNASSGAQPPAAIDNFKIFEVSCSAPSNISVVNRTDNSATISYSANVLTQSIRVFYKSTDSVDWNSVDVPIANNLVDTSYTIMGLQSATGYQLKIGTQCFYGDTSLYSDEQVFFTKCIPASTPWIETFDNVASVTPTSCWRSAQYLYTPSAIMHASAMTPTPSPYWTLQNVGTNGSKAAYVNIFGADKNDWLIMPVVNIGTSGNHFLQFDVRLRKHGIESMPDDLGPDDKFMVLISTDSGNTWDPANTIKWSNEADSTYSYRRLGLFSQTVNIPLSDYTGAISVAFYVESRTANSDDDLIIDNINISSCKKPDSLTVSNLQLTSADIRWTHASSSNFQLEYKTKAASSWTSVPVSATTYTMSSLLPDSTYEVRVRSICNAGDTTSMFATISFKTPCNPVSLPIIECFETTGTTNISVPSCWSYIKSFSGSQMQAISYAGSRHYKMEHSANYAASNDVILISPYLTDPINTLRVKFWAYNLYSSLVRVGHMVDPTDINSFYEDTIIGLTPSWNEYKVKFTGVTTLNAHYIAFSAKNPTAANIVYLDSVTIELNPSCGDVEGIVFSSINNNSAVVKWNSEPTAMNYELRYKKASEERWTEIPSIMIDSCLLNSLQSGSEYMVSLRLVCSATDTGEWSSPISFVTSCSTITSFPFTENFNGATFPPQCWSRATALLPVNRSLAVLTPVPSESTASNVWGKGAFGNETGGSGSPSAKINTNGGNLTTWLLTPPVNIGRRGSIEFDIAMTPFGSTDRTTAGPDDKFMVLISKTGTFSIDDTIAVWTKGASGRHIDSISNVATHITLPLNGYTGDLRIAFYTESTIANANNIIFVDDVLINSIICNVVQNLSVTVSATSAIATWTDTVAGRSEWEVSCTNEDDVTTSLIVNTMSHTFTDLERGKTYSISVRGICGQEDTSAVTTSADVTIPLCDTVRNIGISNECATSAIINFTAPVGQNQWQLAYTPTGGSELTKLITNKPDTLTNLAENTQYQVCIRPVCGIGDTGEYTTPIIVQTNSCDTVEHILAPRTDNNDSVFVSWYNNECHHNWQVSVVPHGTPVNPNDAITANTYQGINIKLINSDASYDVYVRGNCGNGLYSSWNMVTSWKDGAINRSNMSAVKVILSPNPARENTKLSVTGITGNVEMVLMTVDGKVISKENIFCTSELKKDISLKGLAKGTYLIRLTHKDWTKVERLIVQ